MATILLSDENRVYYKDGVSGVSPVVGYESGSRRVCRIKFTAPSSGATSVKLTWYTSGLGAGNKIPILFYIGTSPDSHVNAGPGYENMGKVTVTSDAVTYVGSADILLIPNQTYYLWLFPGADTFGWYNAIRVNYTSTLTTSGAAMSDISGSNGALGNSHTLTLTRYSAALKHTISAKCGTESITIQTGGQTDTVKWTPPLEWAAQNTTGTSVPVKITCTTYDGSTAIGSTSITLVFYIPESVVPTAEIAVSDKQGYFLKYGAYVQAKSQAQISSSGNGIYGSIISSYSVECGNIKKSGETTVFDLPTAGTIKFKLTVTDSRGRTATAEITISVVAYLAPTATILAAYRSDADGNQDDDGVYATVVFKANITPLGNKNSARYTVKYRVKGKTSWSSVTVDNQSGIYAPDGVSTTVQIQTNYAYEFSVSAADDFASIDSIYRTVQVAFFLISTHKASKAVGIGQKAVEAGLCAFGIPAKFNRGITLAPISVTSFDAIDTSLSGIIEKIDDYSVDFCVFNVNGAVWHCILLKRDKEYATAEFYSYGGRRRKILYDGVWGDTIQIR